MDNIPAAGGLTCPQAALLDVLSEVGVLVEEFKYRGAIVKIYVRRGHKPETQLTFFADIWFLLPTVESMNENWQVLYHSLPNGLEGQDAVTLSAREAIRAHLDHLLD